MDNSKINIFLFKEYFNIIETTKILSIESLFNEINVRKCIKIAIFQEIFSIKLIFFANK